MAVSAQRTIIGTPDVAPDFAVFERSPAIPPALHQQVLDAAAALQSQRTRIATALIRGSVVGATLYARGIVAINSRLWRDSRSWRSLLSVRPVGRVEELQVSLPHNRRLVEAGLRMVSVFDHRGTSPQARLLLSGERAGTYVLSLAPLQMKVIDGREVLLSGPVVSGVESVMAVTQPACVAAAKAYGQVVLAACTRASDLETSASGLTPRQHQIVALLSDGSHDSQIAQALGVSIRTIRADIATLMEHLGVTSRFALGTAVQQLLPA